MSATRSQALPASGEIRLVTNRTDLEVSSTPRPPQSCHGVSKAVSITAQLSNNKGPHSRTASQSGAQDGPRPEHKMQQDSAMHVQDDKEYEKSLDFKLVARVQKGDKRAFDLLVVKYQGRVAAVVSRFVSDYHEIADVTQEAFIKAYRAIDRFRGDSAFYTWLYRIAINCAKNFLVARGRRAPTSDLDVDDSPVAANSEQMRDNASPEQEVHRQQLEVAVKQAISALPEDLKVAFSLREFDGLSYEDIASVMECPVGTVRSRIFRARESVDQAVSPMLEGGA